MIKWLDLHPARHLRHVYVARSTFLRYVANSELRPIVKSELLSLVPSSMKASFCVTLALDIKKEAFLIACMYFGDVSLERLCGFFTNYSVVTIPLWRHSVEFCAHGTLQRPMQVSFSFMAEFSSTIYNIISHSRSKLLSKTDAIITMAFSFSWLAYLFFYITSVDNRSVHRVICRKEQVVLLGVPCSVVLRTVVSKSVSTGNWKQGGVQKSFRCCLSLRYFTKIVSLYSFTKTTVITVLITLVKSQN